MDFLNQGIPLGRWFRITVVLHWSFLIFAFYQFRGASDILWTITILLVTFGSVLLHEFGHCFGCRLVKGEATHILLWPLGGLAYVHPPLETTAHLVTVICGPLVNVILWTLFWLIQKFLVPVIATHMDPDGMAFELIWNFVYAMIWTNRIQFLFNVLMPVFPMDGGRILHCILWYMLGYRRSLLIAGMTGTVGGAAFIVLGLGLTEIKIPHTDIDLGGSPNILLVLMGAFFAVTSFGVYRQAELIATWRKK